MHLCGMRLQNCSTTSLLVAWQPYLYKFEAPFVPIPHKCSRIHLMITTLLVILIFITSSHWACHSQFHIGFISLKQLSPKKLKLHSFYDTI